MLHSVLVGIDRYHDQFITPLSCARADAEALADRIERRILEAHRSVRLLVDDKATRRNILVAIGEDLPRAIEQDDVVLLYFAGHGSPERRAARDRRSLYLIPHDAEYARIFATGIDMEREIPRLLQHITEAGAKLVVFLIDACFSGAAGGRTFTGPLFAAQPGERGYLSDPEPVSLEKLNLGVGQVILCAAGDRQVAFEDPTLGHGVFTHALLEALGRPRDGEPTVTITALYDEVSTAVRRASNEKQEPVLNSVGVRNARLPSLA